MDSSGTISDLDVLHCRHYYGTADIVSLRPKLHNEDADGSLSTLDVCYNLDMADKTHQTFRKTFATAFEIQIIQCFFQKCGICQWRKHSSDTSRAMKRWTYWIWLKKVVKFTLRYRNSEITAYVLDDSLHHLDSSELRWTTVLCGGIVLKNDKKRFCSYSALSGIIWKPPKPTKSHPMLRHRS